MTWREAGRRRTAHFRTRAEAERRAGQLNQEAALGDLSVSPEERVLVARLRAAAAGTGLSMEALAAAALRLARGARMPDVDVREARAAWLADCERRGLRPATLRNYGATTERFCEAHGGGVGALTREQVTEWVLAASRMERGRRTFAAQLSAWLRWCARRGWTDDRWRDALAWDAAREDAPAIGVLRPGTARRLLDALPPPYRPAVALLCLCGIRPMEMMRMTWEDVDRRRRVIDVPAASAKTRRGRTLSDLPPAVWAWADWARAHGLDSGRIAPVNYRFFRERIRRTMAAEGLGDWPHDAARHSFASYGYHHLGPAHTVEIMGHVGGYGLFARRYKGAARAWSARLWFALRPR